MAGARNEGGAAAILAIAPVIPVVVIDDPADAVPLAQALVDGGIGIVEITLRTPEALDALERIAGRVEGITVGAGTVVSPRQAIDAAAAGAAFLVSPGSTGAVLDACAGTGLPFLPGVATPSEMMGLLQRGITEAKLFPAEPIGGLALLRAIAGPLPMLRFCPTGGITESSAADYLALPSVPCVGGSWIADRRAVAGRDWPGITERARRAATLRREG